MEPAEIGGYRVSALLGEGGQGVVYLGTSPSGARVAIKVLHSYFASDPETCRRFMREAEVAASVAAFCTAKVVATGMYGPRPYIVSEYVQGPSLDELVKTDGPRTGSGLERLAVATLTALSSIHGAGVVHRDFKPGNVILGPEGPVVIDFGIARALDTRTNTTRIVGTPAYMAPEQFTDDPVTVASDVFSWGSTIAFAATGRLAFPGTTVPAILHAILHSVPDLTGIPHPLYPLVAAALAKDPAVRPSAADLLRDLTGGRALRLTGGQALRDDAHPVAAHALASGAGSSAAPEITPIGRREGGYRAGRHAAPAAGKGGTLVEHRRSGGSALDAGARPGTAQPGPTTWPSGSGSHRKPLRVPHLAVIAGAMALALAIAVVIVPSWRDDRTAAGGKTPVASTTSPLPETSPRLEPASDDVLNLEKFQRVDISEEFASDEDVKQYTSHQPNENEVVPNVATENGVFSATGTLPYYAMLSGPGLLSSGQAISMVTVGRFSATGKPEDSVFVGWVKDGNNYVSAWYNNTNKSSGLNIRLNGELHASPTTEKLKLREGDRFALELAGDTIVSYSYSGGRWRKLQAAKIGGLLAHPEIRKDYRYGFGLRASSGTITLLGAEGRSTLS